jgi:hypothetical protein
MSVRCSDTRGSAVGASQQSVAMSSWKAAMKRSATARGSSPPASATWMILSSMSVKFRMYFTTLPCARRCRASTSKTTGGLALPTWMYPYTVGPQT